MAERAKMRIALLTAVAGLLLAACGGASKTTPSAPAAGQASASSTSTAQSSPATTMPTRGTAGTTTTPGGAVSGLCRAPDLALSYLGGQGATGHGLLGFELRNVSTRVCHTYGFPGIQFLDGGGHPLPTVTTRTTQDFFGSAPARALSVTPGQSVSFRIGVTHGIPSSSGCTTAAAVSVIPPDDTESLRVPIAQGAYECRTATVTPVQPGVSAFR